jgi:hypothetical protein
VIQRKLQVVSDFLDILLARRIWNFRSIDYSTMQYAMFLVVKEGEAPAFGDMFLSARDQRERNSSPACAEGPAFTP